MSYFFAIVMDHPDKPGDDIKVEEMIFHLRKHHVFQTSLLLTCCFYNRIIFFPELVSRHLADCLPKHYRTEHLKSVIERSRNADFFLDIHTGLI